MPFSSRLIHIYFLSLFIVFQLSAQSMWFRQNSPFTLDDYGRMDEIPDGFGSGEFCFQVWILPDTSFPIGETVTQQEQNMNWYSGDPLPYSYNGWWYQGNFLLDGHNNGLFNNGTFSLQFYGGGRIRWHFGDTHAVYAGDPWVIQAYPANSTTSLLDGNWHLITCQRKWTGIDSARLELWVDTTLVADTSSPLRTDMTTLWDSWTGWPQGGWFWGAEKQAAEDFNISQYEDFKGAVDEIKFYDRVKTSTEIRENFNSRACHDTIKLIGEYTMQDTTHNYLLNVYGGQDSILLVNWIDNWSLENVSCGCEIRYPRYFVDPGIPANDSTFHSLTDLLTAIENCSFQDTVNIFLNAAYSPYQENVQLSDFPTASSNLPLIIEGNESTIQAFPEFSITHAVVILRNILITVEE